MSMGRGEEKILCPTVFLSTNTNEQSLGRIMLRRNAAVCLRLIFIVILVSQGILPWKLIFHLYTLPGPLCIHTFPTSSTSLPVNTGMWYGSMAYVSCHLKVQEWVKQNKPQPKTQPSVDEVCHSSTWPGLAPHLMHCSHYFFYAVYFSTASFTWICIILFIPILLIGWVCTVRACYTKEKK